MQSFCCAVNEPRPVPKVRHTLDNLSKLEEAGMGENEARAILRVMDDADFENQSRICTLLPNS